MRQGEFAPIHGNDQVVAMLERWLAEARKGQISYATLTCCQPPQHVGADFVGSIEMEAINPLAQDLLKAKIEAAKLNRTPPPRTKNIPANYLCYNLTTAPCSYDFCMWLINAEMNRINEGAPAPLHVGFWQGRDGKSGLDSEYRRMMFANVVKPALALLDAVEDNEALEGACMEVYTLCNVSAAARSGESVPTFRVPVEAAATVAQWLRGRTPITITLRESKMWPHRNSNMEAWLQFAKDLEQEGEDVILIRDTAKADQPLPGFITCPQASTDLHIRWALYEQCKVNLFVSNGPASLCQFGTKPWLQFVQIDKDDLHVPAQPGWFKEWNGIDEGEQYPWSAVNQRMVWKSDDYGNIKSAWDSLKI